MSDSTLNKFIAAGTAADRAAFTPSPPNPASGPAQGYFWHETDTGDSYSWKAGTGWIKVNSSGAVTSLSTAISTVDSNQSSSISVNLSKITSLSTAVSTVDSNQSTSLSQVSSSLSGAISSTTSLSSAVSTVDGNQSTSLSQISSSLSSEISTDLSRINSLSTAVGSGGGAVAFCDVGIAANSASAFAFKGNTIVPNRTIKVTAVGGLITAVNGATYMATIADLDSATSTTPTMGTVTDSGTVTTTGTDKQYLWFEFASPVTLTAGTAYALMVGRTDSTTTYILPIPSSATLTTIPAFPGRAVFTVRLASTGPANGDTLNTNSGAAPGIAIAFKWNE